MKQKDIVSSSLFIVICLFLGAFFLHSNLLKPQEIAMNPLEQNSEKTVRYVRKLMSGMKERMEKNEDSFPDLIKETEQEVQKASDPQTAALLHSMLAEMYASYYESNSWSISSRTELSEYVPDDVREWTANLFEDTIKAHLTASLLPEAVLQATDVKTYEALMEKEADDALLRPSLFDFLVHRAITIQPDEAWFDRLLAFRRARPEKQALLMAELDALEYHYSHSVQNPDSLYVQKLDSLLHVYEKEPFASEIYIRKTDLIAREPELYGLKGETVQDTLYALYKEAIARYAGYPRTVILKNRQTEMEKPRLRFEIDRHIGSKTEIPVRLNYTNVSKLTVRVYRSPVRPEELWRNGRKSEGQKWGTRVWEQTVDLPFVNTYQSMNHRLTIPALPFGVYACVLSVPGTNLQISDYFVISDLAVLTRNREEQAEALVLHSESGKPVAEATVLFYRLGERGNPVPAGERTSDRFGMVAVPRGNGIRLIRPVLKEDAFAMPISIYTQYFSHSEEVQGKTEVKLFTDRKLYRPGQTVFFKGIAYVKDSETPHVVPGVTSTVIFRDANHKEIANRTCVTNEFGSFNGEFVIPTQALNGSFTLTAGKRNFTIQVEAYKRPSFKIEFTPLEEEVSFGKPLQITGKAVTFSGVSLQGGKVSWTVTRRPFWWRYYGSGLSDDSLLASGMAATDDTGRFTIPFTPERLQAFSTYSNNQTYEVQVLLTDNKGESQEASFFFSVGDCGIILSPYVKDQKMERSQAKIGIKAYTINGKPMDVEGTYQLYRLLDKEAGEMSDPEEKFICAGTFDSRQELPAETFRPLPSGRYLLKAKALDSQGKEATAEQPFILYDLQDKRPPVFTHTWLIPQKTECLPGEMAEFVFGTSDKEAYILYEIFDDKERLKERKRLEMSNECRTFRIPFNESYGEGCTVLFSFLKERVLHVQKQSIYRRKPDRKLRIYTDTFRDQLLPGSREYWKFRIVDADSIPVPAELLAGMYDASLDEITPFSWSFYPVRSFYLPAPYFTVGTSFASGGGSDAIYLRYQKEPNFLFYTLAWPKYALPSDRDFYLRAARAGNAMLMDEAMLESLPMAAKESEDKSEAMVSDLMDENEQTTEKRQPQATEQSVELRRNFSETAFFYPVLTTDKEGNVAFGFTLPESNTTWKLQLLAHTKDLKFGSLSKEIISNKPLMVLPNLPRFLRQNDKVTLSSQLINRSEETLEGTARIELFDPENEQPILCLTKAQKAFTLQKGQTISVDWSFTVPASVSGLVGCRIVATSEKGSDGEQHLLPVLSDEMLVTESTPFFLFDKAEETVRLKGKEGIRPFRMTLEITANPIWYAVQALPALRTPANEDVLSWFASFYGNTLATHIVRSHPRIQKIIERWTAESGTAETLLSNIEKNQELKTVLLQETPWVLEGQNETEQKKRLALLFDLNQAAGLREAAMNQLLQQQTADGGWGWFKGMSPSWNVTLSVLKGLVYLQQLQVVEYADEERKMMLKALRFLDQKIIAEHHLFLAKKRTEVHADILDYLLIRTFFADQPASAEIGRAILYFTDLAWKQWENKSLYEKGLVGMLMWKSGHKKETDILLQWLRKTATVSPEQGMYWANNRRNGYWTSPVETHALLMSFFHASAPSELRETDRMKQWLICQKRTQRWESVPATVHAIYALLLTGSDWLAENNVCEIRWKDRVYSTADGETATGYRKIAFTDSLGSGREETVVSLSKKGTAPAWGAVYRQFFQPIDQIEKQKGVLNVEKKMFVEVKGAKGIEMVPVTPARMLKTGDKAIVRLVVRSDREMDYVFLNDLHAGCFETTRHLSGSIYRDGLWMYRSSTDVAERFFIERLPKGTYVLEYPVYISRPGNYSGGVCTIQCLYAPEFISHTEGTRVQSAENIVSLQH